uniref:Gustatory receptor n=1 Tax=Heterorhabditis bacteriophora TaxID=37862 RepID=A0A1I7WY63_HETBA
MPRDDPIVEEERKAHSAYDLIRMRLDRLEKNIVYNFLAYISHIFHHINVFLLMGFLHALLTGPKLYRIFGEADRTVNIVELIGNNSMSIVKSIFYFSTSLAFSPIILTYLYSRGDLNIHSILTILKYVRDYLLCLQHVYVFFYSLFRMIGRAMDSDYREFISLWSKSLITGKSQDNQVIGINLKTRPEHPNLENLLAALKRYDFELYGVVPDFIAKQNEKLWYLSSSSLKSNLVINAVSWFAVHSFGRHMLYPGSIRLFNWILSTSLHSARNLMVMVKGGQRAWLQSTEGDLIDTMFIQGDEDTLENSCGRRCNAGISYFLSCMIRKTYNFSFFLSSILLAVYSMLKQYLGFMRKILYCLVGQLVDSLLAGLRPTTLVCCLVLFYAFYSWLFISF